MTNLIQPPSRPEFLQSSYFLDGFHSFQSNEKMNVLQAARLVINLYVSYNKDIPFISRGLSSRVHGFSYPRQDSDPLQACGG